MKQTRFRIKANDTIKVTMSADNTGKLLATVYDSGFTTIGEVLRKSISKIPYTNSGKVFISIYNQDTERIKQLYKYVNK